MANVILRRRRPPIEWPELVERIVTMLPDADIEFPAEGVLRWSDGPGVATVKAAAGDAPGWAWEPPPGRDRLLDVRRRSSDRALLVTLLRFYGARSRYWRTDDERGRGQFLGLLDADDPGHSGYPIVDAMADRFEAVLASDPPPPGGERVDLLSDRLRALGYERLWADAFLDLT